MSSVLSFSTANTSLSFSSDEKEAHSQQSLGSTQELKGSANNDDHTEYPRGIKLFLICLALCLSVFLVALDNSIIATPIPKITDEFNSIDDIGWYGSAYLLTTAAFQLMFGKAYSFLPIKSVFLTAIALFEIGSLICGAAPDSPTLIIGRAIAGIGSAGIFSGALIIIAHSVSLEKRPVYTGLMGAMYGVASVAGPLLGGVFTDKVSWRWCFYINLPIGAVAVAVIIFFFKSPRNEEAASLSWKERILQLDLLGTFFFIPAIVAMLLALQWGGLTYAWSNPRIIGLFVAFGVCIIAFIGIQFWKPEIATINPRLVANRSVWAGGSYIFFLGAGFFLLLYYIPIWFQAVKGVSAFQSGIDNIALVFAVVVGSIGSGTGVTKLGYYTPFMIVSTIFMSVGSGLLTTWTPETSSAKWIGYQVITGLGFGLGMQQPLIAVQTVLPINEVPSATALMVFLQTFGGALFVSVGENVFTNKLVKGIVANVPDLNPLMVVKTGATRVHDSVPPQDLAGVVVAYNDALTNSFIVATAMVCCTVVGSLAMEWRSVKGQNITPGAA
ncbi:MAG: hypothetical protein LQ342_000226 [Letrouitia transgressa]|nr:MAG: hypothetical protein LQ342_000226 [Letrouitia transgressa]